MIFTLDKGVPRRHPLRLLVLVVSAAVTASTLAPLASEEKPAQAAISQYQRITRTFPGFNNANVSLGTRGGLDDSCVIHPALVCPYQTVPWKMRPEATAQALAMWTLAARRGDAPTPAGVSCGSNPGGRPCKVDWEVGPSRSPVPVVEPPRDPLDPCDPDKPGFVKPGAWRIDIVADQRSIIEVKRWRGPATTGAVGNQLTCYVNRARDSLASGGGGGVEFRRSDELNLLGWATPYNQVLPLDSTRVWCAWAPQEALLAGHVYFAPLPETPEPYLSKCGGSNLQPAEVLAKFLAAMAAAQIVLAYLDDKVPPEVIPRYQMTWRRTAQFAFSVRQVSTPRQLAVQFGDGTSQTFQVPGGSGVSQFTTSHTFPSSTRYVQTVSLGTSPVAAAEGPATAAETNPLLVTQSVTDAGIGLCCIITDPGIDAKWDEMGAAEGVLGLPTSNSRATSSKPGTVQNFQGGNIYSAPGAGVHEVHGPILSKYAAVGSEGSVLGFPTTDESPTSCRSARQITFEGGAIMWRGDLGAFLSYGPIRSKYASLGYECSYLGLPISDERDGPGPPPGGFTGEPSNGRHQYFQGSDIFWNRNNGDTIAYGQGGGITGNYYSNFTYSSVALRRADAAIDFNWGTGSPGPTVSADNFLVQWRGRIYVPTAGYYTFYTVSDDGVELNVCPDPRGFACGSSLIINNFTDHPPTENASAPIYLSAGTHYIYLGYYERAGGAQIRLLWSGPNIAKQVVPAFYLNASYWGGRIGVAPAATSAAEGGQPATEPAPPSPASRPPR